MSEKIAIFYLIGQYNDRWVEDFYYQQISYLQETGLYDKADFVEVFVKGHIPLPKIGLKFNNITYLGDLEEEKSYNQKKYRAYNYIQQRMWLFANLNPEYKILFFHSFGISHTNHLFKETRKTWRKYLETATIGFWKENVELLDYFDIVGTEYITMASYNNETEEYHAPHFQGFFWWANANYIRKLDPFWFHQDTDKQAFLCELWIGSKPHNVYNIHFSGKNAYWDYIYPDYDAILNQLTTDLQILKNLKVNE